MSDFEYSARIASIPISFLARLNPRIFRSSRRELFNPVQNTRTGICSRTPFGLSFRRIPASKT